jgi:hypothetical protein
LGGKGSGKITGYGEKKMKLKLMGRVLSFLLLIFMFSGCGYTTRSLIVDKYRTIYIQPFVNKVDISNEGYQGNKYRIYRPTLETDITQSVVNKYLFDGNLRPISNEEADLVLKGELVEFRRDPLRYDDNDTVTEYRLNIVVNLSLLDKKENKILWKEDNFTGDTTYFTTGSNAKTEGVAVSDALSDLSRRIVERTVEQW